ncbi:MAG: C1 family peptidase, partial [bacterium]|nr:C1 family peptidase [bacterium]
MKKKLILLVALLSTVQSVNALSYVKEKDNICTETESYKIWKNLSDKEKANTLMPVRCKEFYTKNMNVTSSVGNAFNVDYKTATKFSLLDYNKVSPVSDQEDSSMCWTFATTSAIESAYLIEQNKTINLSERHIDFNTLATLDDNTTNPFGYYNKKKDTGGTYYQSGTYLASGRGPIIETKLPWSTTTSSKANTFNQKIDYYVNEIDYLSDESCSSEIILAMKKNIVEYGAMGAVMYAESPTYISDDKTSYYYNGSKSINHAVTIVGWDDNYSKTNFKTTPAGNGAWLVKNTYPTRFGGTNNLPAGYHYISYYDSKICNFTMNVHKIEEPAFDNSYTNNIHGFNNYVGIDKPTMYFKNVYTRTNKTSEQITKVNIYTGTTGDKYEIYFSGEDDFTKAVKIGEGTAVKEGYTTINVNKTSITTDKYYIYLKYTSIYKVTDSD